MFSKLLLFFLLLLCTGCGLINDKKELATFYNSIAGWDIQHVPIIKPFRVSSTDGGRSWFLNKDELGNMEVSRFGVSQNFIYGNNTRKWFVFDTKSKLFAEYSTEAEMSDCLKSFNLPTNKMFECQDYFRRLAKGITLYWFPAENKEYPDYPAIIPRDIIDIRITDLADEEPNFELLNKPKENKQSVYFFRVLYSKRQNDLYYLSFNNEPPILIKDSLLVPVFETGNMFQVTLYTPYPVAEQKGIPESKRIHKGKQIFF